MTKGTSAVVSSLGGVALTYAMFFATACWRAFRANLALGFGVFPRILITPAFWIVSAVVFFAAMIWKLR